MLRATKGYDVIKNGFRKRGGKHLKEEPNPEVIVDGEIKFYMILGWVAILCLIPLFAAWIYLI